MSKIQEIKARLKKQALEQAEQTRVNWQDFLDHPLLYSALFISGCLSALAGLAIGLGVRVQNGNMVYQNDIVHLFFGVLYAALFPYFYEYGLLNWLNKFLRREPDNKIQQYTSAVMVFLTFLGTAVTAFSAMDILITSLGFFSSFREIPPHVQGWIAFSLPGMLMLNVAAGEMYRQFSEFVILQREADKQYKEAQMEADNEIRLAQMEAKKQIAIHAANEYARQAKNDTPNIGQKKGESTWNRDKTNYAPMTALASETDKPELKDADFTDRPVSK